MNQIKSIREWHRKIIQPGRRAAAHGRNAQEDSRNTLGILQLAWTEWRVDSDFEWFQGFAILGSGGLLTQFLLGPEPILLRIAVFKAPLRPIIRCQLADLFL
jgi:hypothetical protein